MYPGHPRATPLRNFLVHVTGREARRRERRERTTTHTTPRSRRVAYLAHLSRIPEVRAVPRTSHRAPEGAETARVPLHRRYRRFFVTFQNKMMWKAILLFS